MVDKLKTLFNSDLISEHKGSVCIIEEDASASVKTVWIENGDFISLDKKVLDQMNLLFKRKDNRFSLCKGCDGILLCCHSGENYLFFIELKSGYTKDNILKARSQIEASYAKLGMLLNSIEGFQKEDYKYRALIISMEPDIETLAKLQKRIQVASGFCMERFCVNLYNKKDMGLILKHDLSLLKELPLKMDYKFEELPVFFVPFTGIAIDISKYI